MQVQNKLHSENDELDLRFDFATGTQGAHNFAQSKHSHKLE